MATTALDGMTVTREKIYRGAARAVYAVSTRTWPTMMEDVISTTDFELASGWVDLGPTNDDGFTLRRSVETFDGIPIAQLQTNLDEGEPETWAMEGECTLMDTSIDKIEIVWQGGTQAAIAAGGSNVAQHSLPLDAPASFTSRRLAFIQQDAKTSRMRVFVFRDAITQVDVSDLKMGKEASGIPVKFKLQVDTTIELNSGQFGMLFEEDES